MSSVCIVSKVNPGIAPHSSNVTGTNGVSGSGGVRCYHLELSLQGSLPRGKGVTGMAWQQGNHDTSHGLHSSERVGSRCQSWEVNMQTAHFEIRKILASVNTRVSGLHFDLETGLYCRGPRSFSPPLRTLFLLPFLPSESLLPPHLYVLPQFALPHKH